MTKRIASLLVFALLLFSVVTVSTAPSASAYSSSTITSQYWWPHNGCSAPTGDAPSGVSFTYACNHHDGCYNQHWASKGTCDQWFANDMHNACAGYWYCNYWANGYFAAVSAFGWPFYWCRCDPTFTVYFA